MLCHKVTVVISCAGKADHLPGSHVFIAAVHRIGEKAFLSVEEQLLEESLCIHFLKRNLALLKFSKDIVLIFRAKLRKALVLKLSFAYSSTAAMPARYIWAGVYTRLISLKS